MTNLRYPNNYFKNRSQGIRYKLEQNFLNKMQNYIYEEIQPVLKGLVRSRTGVANKEYFNERYFELQMMMENKVMKFAENHFRDILKLSLTEKYKAWHRVPNYAVNGMLKTLLRKSKIRSKSKFILQRMFNDMKSTFSPTLAEFKEKDYLNVSMENLTKIMKSNMSSFSNMIYTNSTYFINSAYELQFKERDPEDKFRYIWGTRADKRRTAQCEMIAKKVSEEMKRTDEKGVKLAWLKKLVDTVANLPGFKKANPDIDWTPHYGCRSGIERVV